MFNIPIFLYFFACYSPKKIPSGKINPPFICKDIDQITEGSVHYFLNNQAVIRGYIKKDFADETKKDLLPNARLLALDCLAEYLKTEKATISESILQSSDWKQDVLYGEWSVKVLSTP